MCGITGYYSPKTPPVASVLRNMASRIAHRGPDGSGIWVDADSGIALAHRRLAIVDLTDAGYQPMISDDANMILTFNGEIYNHHDLRAELMAAGWTGGWRGHSDTETLLAAIQTWGVPASLARLTGMFAFALWNKKRQVLTIARDRAGEKPLYYGHSGETFLFGSELKALVVHPDWKGEIDRNSLTLYMRYGYVPAPHSIFKSIFKLPPAHFVEVGKDQTGPIIPKCYWDLGKVAQNGMAARLEDAPDAIVDQLDARLRAAVGKQMEADVPLGAFLSGGIDSSTIVALMQAQSSQPVQTFTIGFDVPGYNEAENAKAVAAHLGTKHTELYLTPQDALDVVPRLPEIWDEPFADSSQIPTLLLAQMTRQHVTVALSGDAGDELFCGYNRYGQGYSLHRKLRSMPGPLRQMASAALSAVPAHAMDKLVQRLPARFRYPAVGDRLHKLARVINRAEGPEFYRALVSQFQDPADLVLHGAEPSTVLTRPEDWPDFTDFRECMMYLDTLTYLPDDILTKVDRASMAVSLETRVPFLDHDLIEWVWRLPMDVKLRNGQTKWALRQVLQRYVPSALVDRPKMGFGIPIEHWLAGPLKDWASALLGERLLREQGYLNVPMVRKMWTDHCSGKHRWHHQLWTVLMFQAWLRENSVKDCS